MATPLRKLPWTQEEFFSWASAQEGRYEFDGFQPVAMTGGTVEHDAITHNLYGALRPKLRGSGCRVAGPNVGVATIGSVVRYPDALITCAKQEPGSLKIIGAVVVFEVLSASTSRTDRIDKVSEYAAVESILRYVIVESTSVGLMVMERKAPNEVWRTYTLGKGSDILHIPEVAIEIPVAELYEDVTFPSSDSKVTVP